MPERNPKFISLFSGAGGLDLGLEMAGWEAAYATDSDPCAVQSLLANAGWTLETGGKALSNCFVEQADVRKLAAVDILSKSGLRRGAIELLAGGPPCQSWSSAGRQQGFNDPRGQLFEDFIRISRGLDARWLLIENVRGLLTARGLDGSDYQPPRS